MKRTRFTDEQTIGELNPIYHAEDPADTVQANELWGWGSEVLDRIAGHIDSQKLSMVQSD